MGDIFESFSTGFITEFWTGETKYICKLPETEKRRLMHWVKRDVKIITGTITYVRHNYQPLTFTEVVEMNEIMRSCENINYEIKSDTELKEQRRQQNDSGQGTLQNLLMFEDVFYYPPPQVAEELLYHPLVAELVRRRIHTLKQQATVTTSSQ